MLVMCEKKQPPIMSPPPSICLLPNPLKPPEYLHSQEPEGRCLGQNLDSLAQTSWHARL